MTKRSVLAALAILTLWINCFGQQPEIVSGRYVAPDGEFSYLPPSGWMLYQEPGKKFKTAFTKPIEEFTPNLNFIDEVSALSLEDYTAASFKVVPAVYEKLGFKNFKILLQSKFSTDARQPGIKVVTQNEFQGHTIRQTFYIFGGDNNKKLVVTFTVSGSGADALESLVDAALKTWSSGTENKAGMAAQKKLNYTNSLG